MVRIYATLAITAAEGAALVGLYTQEATYVSDGLVWLGLAVAIVALGWPVLNRQWRYLTLWWKSGGAQEWWLILFLVVTLAVITIYVLARFRYAGSS